MVVRSALTMDSLSEPYCTRNPTVYVADIAQCLQKTQILARKQQLANGRLVTSGGTLQAVGNSSTHRLTRDGMTCFATSRRIATLTAGTLGVSGREEGLGHPIQDVPGKGGGALGAFPFSKCLKPHNLQDRALLESRRR